ncbi:HNH endonuclease [Pontibacterium sp.]|uniref:HNH endonuclease n=1 Tax=Pontibacterium sp. TaxID=2036026 RepID=UPI00351216AF
MKSSSLPCIVEPDNFKTFIKYRKGDTRANLLSIKKKIQYYYNHYNSHNKNIHKIKPRKLCTSEKNTMIDVYESYESKAIVDFRDTLFDHISKCPYCGLNETVHLDHYLPKSEFAEYSLFTKNLIPCCYSCNSTYKKTSYEENGSRVYFHPYIDSIDSYEVLRLSIRWIEEGMMLHYGINQSSGLDPDTTQVLKKHFKHLQLGKRYLQLASDYLSDMKPRFNEDYGASSDAAKLKQALESKYKDALSESGRNNWKTALLKNLKNNEQFYNGGFLEV